MTALRAARYPDLQTQCAVCGTRARCFCEQPNGEIPRFLERRLTVVRDAELKELEELV